MTYSTPWRRVRLAIPLILLSMVLMRLVWMQLRTYPVVQDARTLVAIEMLVKDPSAGCVYEMTRPAGDATGGGVREQAVRLWLTSPGHALMTRAACRWNALADRHLVRTNQFLFAAIVLLATLMTRFLTSSWTVSLIVAAVLFSRGRLLADLGRVSADWFIAVAITGWLACLAHYLRTGARVAFFGAAACVALAAAFDRALAALALAMPAMLLLGFAYRRQLARPVIQRLREVNRQLRDFYHQSQVFPDVEVENFFGRLSASVRWMLGMEFPPREATGYMPSYQRGGLFRTLAVPFLLWAYHKRRWLRISAAWTGVFGLVVLLAYAAFVAMAGGTQPQDVLAGIDLTLGGGREVFDNLWALAAFERFDLHLTVSLLVLLYCAVQSPAAGLTGFLEATWLTLAGMALLALACYGLDLVDAALVDSVPQAGRRGLLAVALGPRPFMLWLEPVALSLGVAGIYNLMKVFDTRVAERG